MAAMLLKNGFKAKGRKITNFWRVWSNTIASQILQFWQTNYRITRFQKIFRFKSKKVASSILFLETKRRCHSLRSFFLHRTGSNTLWFSIIPDWEHLINVIYKSVLYFTDWDDNKHFILSYLILSYQYECTITAKTLEQ